jgi:copper resistance protein B
VRSHVLALCLAAPATAAGGESFTDPEERELPADYRLAPPRPDAVTGIRKYAIDEPGDTATNFGVQPVHDNMIFWQVRGDRFEHQWRDSQDVLLWDIKGWIGTDYNKLYVKSEGDYIRSDDDFGEVEVEFLYSRNIASFWDLQAGLRHDFVPNQDDRDFAALGLQGMAPYRFEVEATAYVSDDADLSAVVEGEYEILLTQTTILQPRIETSIAAQQVSDYGVGPGFNEIELGLRLRRELWREFAPYVGVSWSRKLGQTADLAREEGEKVSSLALVAGVRFWF